MAAVTPATQRRFGNMKRIGIVPTRPRGSDSVMPAAQNAV
jgi:hypothetical protein